MIIDKETVKTLADAAEAHGYSATVVADIVRRQVLEELKRRRMASYVAHADSASTDKRSKPYYIVARAERHDGAVYLPGKVYTVQGLLRAGDVLAEVASTVIPSMAGRSVGLSIERQVPGLRVTLSRMGVGEVAWGDEQMSVRLSIHVDPSRAESHVDQLAAESVGKTFTPEDARVKGLVRK